jgi:TonB family protein
MTAQRHADTRALKRAMIFSAAAHTALLLLILVNPELPKPQRKSNFIYIPTGMIGLPGGGGGGRGGPQTTLEKTPVKKETLRDLTTPQKAQAEPKAELRYPTDKAKKAPAKKPEKKTVISKSDPAAKTAAAREGEAAPGQSAGGGRGSGLTIGAGGPGYGEGGGGDWAGQIGLQNFPYTYYLQNINDRISSNWFTSLVDPGVSGFFQVAVYFRIYRNGSISNIEIRQSSGLSSLDLSAKRAIVQSAPFPPLPADYNEDYLGVLLIFEHSK